MASLERSVKLENKRKQKEKQPAAERLLPPSQKPLPEFKLLSDRERAELEARENEFNPRNDGWES